jgi:glycosyltransferase involved in cell wall biosynthesis
MPLLKAVSWGCPAVCSRPGSLPEIGSDAAEFFDSRDEHSMSQALKRVIDDKERAAQLAVRGEARAAAFSWERCARETLALYRRVVQ